MREFSNRHATGSIFGQNAGQPGALAIEHASMRMWTRQILHKLVGPVTEREHIAPEYEDHSEDLAMLKPGYGSAFQTVDRITEYGTTTRLSRPVRVF